MLHFENVTYTYPFRTSPALEGVTLDVQPGQAVLVTGPSGGGKSTLLRLMNGLIPQVFGGRVEGMMTLEGQCLLELPLREISQIVSTLFQDPEKQFLALNVYDEIAFALEWRASRPAEVSQKTEQAISDFKLESIRRASIYELSDGQKQKVALAGLAAMSPRVMTLDEPTANLDPAASAELATHLAALKAQGMTLVIADHRLAWLRDVVDQVFVVAEGRLVASGDWSVLEDVSLREQYGLRMTRWPEHEKTLAVSCVKDSLVYWEKLEFAYRGCPQLFEHADIHIPRSAVTALCGPNGCGKTTLARLMAGLIKPQRGRLIRNNQMIRPRDLLAMTGMVMQNSELQIYHRTALDEIMHAAGSGGRRLSEQDALRWLGRFGLESMAAIHPQSFSGGQKQRLVVACAAARAGELLILDEPTSGLDGAQMHALADLLDERRDAGLASLVITHDLELVQRVCTHQIRLPLRKEQTEKR